MSSIHVVRCLAPASDGETRHWQPQGDVNYGAQKVEQNSTTGGMTIVTAAPQGDPTENKWEMLSSEHWLWSEHS